MQHDDFATFLELTNMARDGVGPAKLIEGQGANKISQRRFDCLVGSPLDFQHFTVISTEIFCWEKWIGFGWVELWVCTGFVASPAKKVWSL